MKIYTKTGDKGKTSLASGKRVSKSDDLVSLYGTCDELNSQIGVAISFLLEDSTLKEPLFTTQNILFELGSELAGFRLNDSKESIIYNSDIEYLEIKIDELQSKLTEMRSFILPGGAKSSGFLHVARTICRRLEREMVLAKEKNLEIFEMSLIYVNRLSDFLFVAARFANQEESISDIKWTSRAKQNK
ncbi:MAG TPA: cob(I)yrinic acid a,c-diamide adenosyltransferase [Leptospiraceae bacterium]|nr:cob(I)yrinic acid a,c-diamide adenosyltransferase [Leptospiraceae bacterium]HMW05746.1 cob(I)yrinic acid a,c-diamide adenosyltransferase [Leptospiraceae bacterium]HMX32487.1 cob(I)yrinic acid a,c-diamide adenosyltransferase [Leptospiraceae bacterium]HMY30221.1 cob(I)yrinic acid a,c-diamide adenosyltransferase [Leptospiraceae bacterium]HMZ67170.1 cob(I)yrinic acid a,c-diamide adenosyltransferase [Leptospiraceae bacterium]